MSETGGTMRCVRSGFATLVGLVVTLAVGPTADAAGPRHVIYLHGRIIQETQSSRPQHPRFGRYELDEILEAFRDRGFEVTGEIRPKSASFSDSADRVATQVRQLLDSGVTAENVMVVGGSMGGAMALLVSTRLQQPDVRFGILGACMSGIVGGFGTSEGQGPAGRVLSIREKSDDFTEPCPPWSGEREGLVVREIVLETGLAHGFLYRPLPEWVDPVVEWAGGTAGASQ